MSKYTAEQLKSLSSGELVVLVLSMQDQLDRLNENFENLVEQLRISNSQRFGRKTERLQDIEGQLSLFNEIEAACDLNAPEPEPEELLPAARRKKKEKGKREEDLKDLPEEPHPHTVSREQLDALFGEGNYRRLADETYKRLRCRPMEWVVEVHTVEVYVGTGGEHQDEFLRADRPKDLLRNSIVTPSLEAAVINAKYVNALPLYRIEQEFARNGVNLSRQTMSNWTISCAERYFAPFYERLRQELLKCHVNHCDETPVDVIHDGRDTRTNSYMWVHRTGELSGGKPVILYEWQPTRHHRHPVEFYRGYHGVVVTDGLQQYHLTEKELEGFTNANCWTHARRFFADAVKAMGKSDAAVRRSTAFQALTRIAAIYKLEEALKDLSPEERLKERQKNIRSLVEEYFAWAKALMSGTTVLPKGKTAQGLNYSINQEKYLKVFLDDGEVPIDNSAAERAIRPFCIGKKNWVLINTMRGAGASAILYSIAETAKANDLNTFAYFEYLLTKLSEAVDEKGNIDTSKLDPLLPWADELPAQCHKPRR